MATNNAINNQWLSPNLVTTGTFQMVNNSVYVNQNSTPANMTIYTLPATSTVGDVIVVMNLTSGGFKIAQNAGQEIVVSSVTHTTTGVTGYYSTTDVDNTSLIQLLCTAVNTTWTVMVNNSLAPTYA